MNRSFGVSLALVIVAACGSGGDGDGDGNAPALPNAGATADDCVDRVADASCLDESKAFFVAGAKGDDVAGLGTKDKPVRSVAAALSRVTPEKRRIYICEGTYAEDVALGPPHSGISLFGGVTCDWRPSTQKPRLGLGSHALRVEGASAVVIADLTFEAKDSVESDSSVAAFVRSADVMFKRVTLTAGKAAKGPDGILTPVAFPLSSNLRGNDAKNGVVGAEKRFDCFDGSSSTGGKGGELGSAGESGTPGPPNGGRPAECTMDQNSSGQDGATAPAAPGAIAHGDLLTNNWQPAAGSNGANGAVGQGGGGSAGIEGGVGGGGGGGGCGGAGGGGGKGGGASIGLASLDATVRIEASSITTNAAGAGGSGALGQPGQTSGGGGGNGTVGACKGGPGGRGGNGATGGGGAGGVSIGVLYKGLIPTLDVATKGSITPGVKGEPGRGSGQPGIDGVSASTFEAKSPPTPAL